MTSRDALGRVSSAEYDKRGLVVKQVAPSYTAPGTTTPVVPTTTFEYDANGNQTKVTDPRGVETRYGYDRLGRVVKVDAASHDNDDRAVTTYAYTRTGQVSRIEGPLGTKVESTYDDLDRPITSTLFETTPVADTFTTSYAYDDASNVTEVTSPGLNKTTSTYDALGQPAHRQGPRRRAVELRLRRRGAPGDGQGRPGPHLAHRLRRRRPDDGERAGSVRPARRARSRPTATTWRAT
ncbi:RHS repeat protein [Nocardioides sp. W3-2-3]|nr:RHS repeat protein [Nocardioides convexus]